MKKLILFVVIITTCFSTMFSQTINGKPINELEVDYVEIMCVGKMFSNKISIYIDYGQHVPFMSFKNELRYVMNENRKPYIFASPIDALDLFSKNGFEYVNTYAYAVGNQSIIHHLLRKKSSKN